MHTIATNAHAFISHQGSCILQHSMLMHSLALQALAITSSHCSPVIYSQYKAHAAIGKFNHVHTTRCQCVCTLVSYGKVLTPADFGPMKRSRQDDDQGWSSKHWRSSSWWGGWWGPSPWSWHWQWWPDWEEWEDVEEEEEDKEDGGDEKEASQSSGKEQKSEATGVKDEDHQKELEIKQEHGQDAPEMTPDDGQEATKVEELDGHKDGAVKGDEVPPAEGNVDDYLDGMWKRHGISMPLEANQEDESTKDAEPALLPDWQLHLTDYLLRPSESWTATCLHCPH